MRQTLWVFRGRKEWGNKIVRVEGRQHEERVESTDGKCEQLLSALS